jgi:hypothetical protein
MYLGLDSNQENEGHDRQSLELPGQQMALALAVAAAAKSPVVIVLVNGGTISLAELKQVMIYLHCLLTCHAWYGIT